MGLIVTESPCRTVIVGFGVVEEFQAATKPRRAKPRFAPWAWRIEGRGKPARTDTRPIRRMMPSVFVMSFVLGITNLLFW